MPNARLLPAALRAAGVTLVAINPLALLRYRDRLSPSRTKSRRRRAFVLANILRTDPHNHRPLPVHSELVQAIHVLDRAHQAAVRDRMQIANTPPEGPEHSPGSPTCRMSPAPAPANHDRAGPA
jgi:hypothetical protein